MARPRPGREFRLAYKQVEPPLGDADAQSVAGLHKPKGSAGCSLRRNMQHDSAESRSAHPGVRQSQHILDAAPGEFHRDRKIARLRHAAGDRAGIAQHQRVVGFDVQVGIVDPLCEIFEAVEHDGARGDFKQFLVGGGSLQDRPIGRKASEQGDETPIDAQGIVERPDGGGVEVFAFRRHIGSEPFAGDRRGVEIEQWLQTSQKAADAARKEKSSI